MIVVGVDVHKHSLTAVAVDDAGRVLEERTLAFGERRCLLGGWARSRAAVGDRGLPPCHRRTRADAARRGEELVRVPPKLTGPARRTGKERGKSDPIDALAVARAGAPGARSLPAACPARGAPGAEAAGRPSRRSHRRAPPHPAAAALASARARPHPYRAAARARPGGLARTCRPLAGTARAGCRCGSHATCQPLPLADPMIDELDRELEQRSAQIAPALLELPGCGGLDRGEAAGRDRPDQPLQNDAQLARHSGVAPLQASSGKSQRHRLDRGGNRQLNSALYRIAITQSRVHPPARAYLERKQAEGKSKTRSAPLPQTTARTNRLQHPQNEPH